MPLSPYRGRRELLSGEELTAVVDGVDARAVDALWVVGGEAGGVSLRDGYRMNLPPGAVAAFESAPRAERRRLIAQSSGLEPGDLPYLGGKRAALGDLPLIVNSVGLAGLENLRVPQRRCGGEILDHAAFVSVREGRSSALLDRSGIPHTVAPDLVHTIRFDRRRFSEAVDGEAAPYALVQFSSASVRGLSPHQIADALANANALRAYEIVFFSAGDAPGHDDRSLYREVAARLTQLDPGRRARVSVSGGVDDRVSEIAGASLIVGTSLHVMILSLAFDVPHVGLLLQKISTYGRYWGDSSSYGVDFRGLDEAITLSTTPDRVRQNSDLADLLAMRAQENVILAMRALRVPRQSSKNASIRRLPARPMSVRQRLGLSVHRLRNPLV